MIVVDASIAVKLVLDETDSDRVRAPWQRWTDESEVIAVPPFFASETLSAPRRNLAKRFNRPTIYDCCYLALASLLSCEFWTADIRLVNALGHELPWVRHPT